MNDFVVNSRSDVAKGNLTLHLTEHVNRRATAETCSFFIKHLDIYKNGQYINTYVYYVQNKKKYKLSKL